MFERWSSLAIYRRKIVVGCLAAIAVGCACSGDPVVQAERQAEPTAIAAPRGVSPSGAELSLEVIDTSEIDGLITDHRGFAAYGNRNESPGSIDCVDSCATIWLPLEPRDDAVSTRLDEDKFATIERPDGTRQVSYDGIALYLWTGDREVGVPAGAGVAGIWFAITASGATIG